MSLQALVPIAKTVGTNLAKAGFQAVKRRRAGKIAKKQWVLGSRVMGIPFDPSTTIRGRRKARKNKGRVYSTRGAPVKQMNASIVLRNVAQTVRDADNLNTLSRKDTSVTKITQKYVITPTAEAYFPRLYQLARTYQKYSCLSLGIAYANSAATNLNGTLHMAFVPRVDVDPGEYTEPEDFACLPGYTKTSISRPARMVVPVEQMNKRGQELYCSNGSTTADADEPLLFFTGTFILLVESLDAGTGPLEYGTLTVDYTFNLKDPVIDKSTSSSLVFGMNTPEADIIYSRSFSGQIADSVFTLVKRKPCILAVKTDALELTGLLLNGVHQTPVSEMTSNDGLNVIRWYHYPRLTRRNEFSITENRPAHIMCAEMDASVMEAFERIIVNPLSRVTTTTTTTTTATAAPIPKHAHRLSNQ